MKTLRWYKLWAFIQDARAMWVPIRSEWLRG